MPNSGTNEFNSVDVDVAEHEYTTVRMLNPATQQTSAVGATGLSQTIPPVFAPPPRLYPHHQAILNHRIPLSIGGGTGQSRALVLLLRRAHRGEVSATVWPKILKEMCARKNIFAIE